MNESEFLVKFKEGAIVHCTDKEQRRSVLEYLHNAGFEIGDVSKSYMEYGVYSDFDYPNPGLSSRYSEHVCCYNNSVVGNHSYDVVEYWKFFEAINGEAVYDGLSGIADLINY